MDKRKTVRVQAAQLSSDGPDLQLCHCDVAGRQDFSALTPAERQAIALPGTRCASAPDWGAAIAALRSHAVKVVVRGGGRSLEMRRDEPFSAAHIFF